MNTVDSEDAYIEYRWDRAEMKRMNRTREEVDALYQRLARQWVRYRGEPTHQESIDMITERRSSRSSSNTAKIAIERRVSAFLVRFLPSL